MCYDVIGVGVSSWKHRLLLIHTDEKRIVRWSEEGNKWRWLRPFRVGNEKILHHILTASAAALNETLGLNALSSMELHANLRAALWPANNCGSVLRERSQRFSSGLQLRGLHITIHNRLNMSPSILSCSACAAQPAGAVANTLRKVIKCCKMRLLVLFETLPRPSKRADKRNGNGTERQRQHCLLHMYIQWSTLHFKD